MLKRHGRSGLKILLFAGVALGAGLVHHTAQAQTAPAPAATDFWHRPLMTGDWDGARTKLKNDGIVINGFYTGEFADAFAGGKHTGSTLASQFGLGMDADLGKLAGLNGAILHFAVNQRVGRSTSADYIGNKMAVQEDYGAGDAAHQRDEL